MIEILRWFFGWSEFKIEGDSSNFLTKFKRNIWMVRKQSKFVIARCLTKNYAQLKKESVKYGCFLTIYKNAGFLNFLKRYKFRSGLLIGLITFCLALFISSFFVWNVEIFGNSLVSDEQIYKICDENGLHFGSSVFSVNENDIEYKIKEKFPEISWISINRVAGKYLIEVSESKEKPNIVDWDGPCDVVANFGGEILYVEPYSGTPLVDVGDSVKKGQLLISGAQKTKGMDEIIYSPSDAKILAKVIHHNEVSLEKNSEVDVKTGNKKVEKHVYLFGLKIPLKLHRKKDNVVKVSEKLKPLEFFGIRFPALMRTTTYDVYKKVNCSNDVVAIKRVLFKKQKEWELKELMGNSILDRKYDIEEKGDNVILKADVAVEQRIDKKVPIVIENEEDEKKRFGENLEEE